MNMDTKWIVGTGAAIILSVVGTGVALGGLLSIQFTAIDARFDDVNARFDDLRADLTAEIATVKADLSSEIATVKADLSAEIATVKADLSSEIATVKADLSSEIAVVRDDLRRMDDRLRAVEIAFGKVDQRLETLERLHLPGPDAGE